MECRTPSRPLTWLRSRSAKLSRCSSLVTSSSSTGAGLGSRLAIRSTSLIRPNPVTTTSAPCSWATFATWKAIEESVMTPVTRILLPSSNPLT